MKTPMLSRRYVPTSLKISSDMIKVGKVQHPRPFEERMKDYRGTYKCSTCNKSHFSVVSYWELIWSLRVIVILREMLKLKDLFGL